MGELRILARGGLVSLTGSIASGLFGLGFVVFLGRTLSVRQAGGLFEAIAIFTMFSYATVLGADWGLLKIMPTFGTRHERRILSIVAIGPALVACAGIAITIFVEATPIARLVIHHGSVAVAAQELRILAPFLPLATVMAIALAGIRGWSINESVFVQSLLVPIGRVLLMAVFLIVGVTPLLGAIAFGSPLGVGALVGIALLLSHLGKPIGVEGSDGDPPGAVTPHHRIFVEFWKFSGPRSFGGLFSILLIWLDLVLLGALGSSKQVAAYTVASRYILIGTVALASVGTAIAPQLSRLWAAGRTRAAQTVYRESTWWIMGISWPVLLLMALFAPLFISIVSRKYSSGILPLEILALATLANTGTGNSAVAILMAGKSLVNFLIEGASLGLNIVLNVILIPKYGSTGAAIAWSVSILFTAAAASFAVFRIAHIHPFGSGHRAISISALVSFGVLGLGVRLALGATWTSGAIVAVLGSALYVGGLAMFQRHGWLDLRELRTLVAGTIGGSETD